MFDVANIGRISESSKFSENYLSHIEVRHFCVMGYYIQSVAPRGKDCGIDILMDISEDNQSLILETIDGNLISVTDEMPTTFHGCYVTRKVIGKVKMTVGIRRRTHEKVQYCITAIQAT